MNLRGRRTHRATALATALASLTLAGIAGPAAAAPTPAERTEMVSSVMRYSSGEAQEDWVTITAGGTAHPGGTVLTEERSPSGTIGPGCAAISGQPAAVCGGVASIQVYPLDQADRVVVDVAIPATVDGGDGDDTITGGSKGDSLTGGLGADTIEGRGGYDIVSAGAGNDTVHARDGLAEWVDCGADADVVYADTSDWVAGCEIVHRPAAGTEPTVVDEPIADPVADEPRKEDPLADDVVADDDATPGGDPGGDVPVLTPGFDIAVLPGILGPVRLIAGTVNVGRAGVARLGLACAATEASPCRGSIYLDPALSRGAKGKAKGKGKARGKDKSAKAARVLAVMARRGRYGRSAFVIAAGKHGTIDVALSKAARAALGIRKKKGRKKAHAARRGRTIRARVTIAQKGKRPQRTVIRVRG